MHKGEGGADSINKQIICNDFSKNIEKLIKVKRKNLCMARIASNEEGAETWSVKK